MRKGFRSSRGAMRGTMGGAPICLVGVVGFATVAIGVGPFVYSICLSNFALHLAQVQFIENSGYPFAASFFELTAYASRQAVEQKCTSSPPSRNGMERVSSTCIPHTGSRTNRRAAVGVSIEASAACGPGAVSFRSMPRSEEHTSELQS